MFSQSSSSEQHQIVHSWGCSASKWQVFAHAAPVAVGCSLWDVVRVCLPHHIGVPAMVVFVLTWQRYTDADMEPGVVNTPWSESVSMALRLFDVSPGINSTPMEA